MTVEDRAFERLRLANPAPVTVIEERPAGAVALAAIQDRSLGELERLSPARPPQRRRWLVAVAVAVVVLLLIGVPALLTDRSDDVPPATEPVVPTTSAQFDPGAQELVEPMRVVRGSYFVEQMGTPLSLTFAEDWVLQRSELGFLEFTESATAGGSDGSLFFIRATELSNPTDPFRPIEVGQGLAPTELETWLVDVEGALTIFDRSTVEVGGRSAIRFDVGLDEDALCGTGPSCAYLVTTRGYAEVGLDRGDQHRVWWIDEPGFDPIVIVATGDGDALFNKVDMVLETIGFGPPAPHPVSPIRPWEAGVPADAPAGDIRLPSLGGIEFDLFAPAFLDPSQDAVTVEVSSVATVAMSYVVGSLDGDSVRSTEDVLNIMRPELESLEEVEWSRDWNTGRAFDLVRGAGGGPTLTIQEGDGLQWVPPATGRIWLFETERGVLFIAAGSLEGTFDLGRVVVIGERIAETIELIDLSQ